MLEEYDPYLSNFISDVGTCISASIKFIEIILGIFYFIGCKSVEAVKWTYSSSTKLYNDLSILTTTVHDEVSEFGGSIVRAVLLIFYGIQKIFESFYITAVDIQNFCVHFTESISRTVAQTWSFLTESVSGALCGVPVQIVDALSLVGESTVNCFHTSMDIVQDFLLQMIISPIKVVLLILKTMTNCIILPIKFICGMPTSSVLGLFVLIASAYVCRRMLRYLILRNILRFLGTILSLLTWVLSFIRLTRLTSLITSTVLTVTKLQDDNESSGSCKIACVICQDKPVSFMSNPCKHVCLCDSCVRELVHHDNKCPICRGRVSQYDRVFIP